ncbi:MAG: protein-tyrosine-phosphatase [Nitrospinaceae bacterium]|nr:MAG: protein-tyrosine-phosphatase [Nitrospinaceae bacterium]
MIEVCFVCLGNICRSPLAQGVFEKLVAKEGLDDKILISSAGTGNWHIGSPPDERMQKTANKYNVQLNSRGQQFQTSDFKQLDLILAMDHSNLMALEQISPDPKQTEKLRLFRSFDPEANGDLDVPDPYYGGGKGFEIVYQIVERTCPIILEFLKKQGSFNA